MTKVQKAILELMVRSKGHLSAAEVYSELRRQFPSIALGTVYRNLNRFADSRLIRRVPRAGAADYFEGNVLPHDHALCVRCGRMKDIKIPNLKDFLKDQMNCEIVSFDLTVNYICPECSDKNSDSSDGGKDESAQYKEKSG